MTQLRRDACRYTKQYCEENVYLLAEQLRQQQPLAEIHAVFISNPQRKIPLWRQQAAREQDLDYHVVLLVRETVSDDCIVYDLDTTLDFPCSFRTFAIEALRADIDLSPDYRRYGLCDSFDSLSFRMANGGKTSDGLGWIAPPPSYAPIRPELCNLQKYIDMEQHMVDNVYGDVLSETQFLQQFLL
ncbi:N-terminal glutamine amidase-domain-containing protein [Thamnocephalis sphaerospora]|uniref:Protein N-terminal glutamine amidohydrolase n=1 Tax=Thamnocephalis sphaerospora TaxID=78915 RepID=A0A4P9XUY1_9FUNG|nr:N-terminal glutamine amidase-domain-containing protein [Thamnocephalis sphaerospora]|eukprot:RKP09792.1 N-terminal glutamine amidase-domain-containing protein [Thamnocephalis sphaerospora]